MTFGSEVYSLGSEVLSLSIIMASYNRAADLSRVLQAYDAQTTCEPFEILVVDNASSNSTANSYKPSSHAITTCTASSWRATWGRNRRATWLSRWQRLH